MKLLVRLALLACLLLVGGVGVHARGTLESSLQEVGGNRRDLLYVVLFSLPDCPYCVAVRDAYLPALLDDPRFRGRVRIREVSIGSPRLLKDFNGDRISHADIARRYKVKFAPTVLFLDAQGQPRADALLGGDSVGLYGGYLENRVTQGLAQ
ncbi:MAG TPA: hypothetical protein PKZ19_04620 [Zoogloea sp.]|nr:hypothetical protein [Zoogloea sp.]